MPSYTSPGYVATGYFETVSSPSVTRPGDALARIAVSRLTGQFDASERLKSLVYQIVNPIDTLIFDADAVGNKRWIDNAVGTQLDGCGYIIGELRNGRSDDDYRDALKFRVFVNVSNATPNDLIKGLKYLTKPQDCQYIEAYPASAILFTDGVNIQSDIQAQIQDLSPAAVNTVPVCVSYGQLPFRFSREAVPSELFVNNGADYLSANNSDVQVSATSMINGDYSLGGCVPSDLSIGAETYIDVNGDFLAVYNPNTAKTLGHDILTGVYQ